MSSTNKTTNYQLSQFVGTDIPSILNDYNGDMRKIDSAIKEVAIATGDEATDIAELQATVSRHTTEISGINSNVNTISGRVLGIEDKIPANASSENKLITAQDIPEIPSVEQLEQDVAELQTDVGQLQTNVVGIGAVIPATASASNKLATMADVGGAYTAEAPLEIVNNNIKLVFRSIDISYGSLTDPTYAEVLELVKAKLRTINNGDDAQAFVAIKFENNIYRAYNASGYFGCRDGYHQTDHVLVFPYGASSCSYYVDGVDKSSDTVDPYGSKTVSIYGLFDPSNI